MQQDPGVPSGDLNPAQVLRRALAMVGGDLPVEQAALLSELQGFADAEQNQWSYDINQLEQDVEVICSHVAGRPARLHGDKRHVQLMATCWATTTFRQVTSAFILHRQGLSDTAVPNIRTALEHAVYLSLIASSQDAGLILDVLERQFVRGNRRIFADATTAGDTPPDPLLQLLAYLPEPQVDPPTTHWPESLYEVCKRITTGNRIYYHYRWLCSALHPGLGVLMSYMEMLLSPEALNSGELNPQPTLINPALIYYLATASCVWSAWSLEDLGLAAGVSEIVDPIAARLGLTRLRRIQPGDAGR